MTVPPSCRALLSALLSGALLLGLAACAPAEKTVYPDDDYRRFGKNSYDTSAEGGLFGPNGIALLGEGEQKPEGGAGIGVNAFLWRASLDTLAFMPLASADPFGGVIITDWYAPPEAPQERFKINVFILGRDLRADGLRASVFRQQRGESGWVDAEVADKTSVDIENAILTRARQLRIAAVQ